MRISDWSSDVCSSDLIDQSINKLNHGGRLVITTILIETMFKAMKTVNESNLLKDSDFTQIIISKGRRTKNDTMMLARKIGRASCSKRVCQTVWISGVAVS